MEIVNVISIGNSVWNIVNGGIVIQIRLRVKFPISAVSVQQIWKPITELVYDQT